MKILQQGPIIAWSRRPGMGSKGARQPLSYEVQDFSEEHSTLENPRRFIVFQLIGGPTGFEGFVLEDDQRSVKPGHFLNYWSACFGNSTYNELRISSSEMDRVLSAYWEQFAPVTQE